MPVKHQNATTIAKQLLYLGSNLIAWQSQRHSLVVLSSGEAEFIANIWGNKLALSLYGHLNEMILSKPPAIVNHQDSYQTFVYASREPHGCIT